MKEQCFNKKACAIALLAGITTVSLK